MRKYLIDVNLPYYFSLWNNENYIYQRNINSQWKDNRIWDEVCEISENYKLVNGFIDRIEGIN
ncbi:MAG: hypothetical protein JEY97_14850 [Bacteroidales bacterium]|nr:hypothetical protein [Bacteroidales bacterium]